MADWRVPALATVLCTLPLAAAAQSGPPMPIEVGDAARGVLDRPNPGTNPAPAVACYAIETPPDTDLAITLTSTSFRPEIWFARGALCSSAAVQDRAAATDGDYRNARLRVRARGGRSLIMVRGTSSEATGAYQLRVAEVAPPAVAADTSSLPGVGNNRPGGAGPGTAPGASGPSTPPPVCTATLARLNAELNMATGGPEGIEADRIRLMNQQVQSREDELREQERIRAEQERLRREAELERQRQLAFQQQQEEQSGGNGGLFGAVLGGGIAALAGGNTDMILQGASTMANVVDPNSFVAQGLSTVSSASSDSNGYGTALAPAIGSAGGAGAANYPTQPNALDGEAACSRFTLQNYQQLGLNGGDPQMDAQCANAMSLYASYLNAIRRGFSEAEAMQTYRAHQQAAQVAIQFYLDTR